MTSETRNDVGAMLRLTIDLARENAAIVVAAAAVLAGLDILQDRFGTSAASIPRFVASILFQYQVTLAALKRRGYGQPGPRGRFWALLGLVIVSEVGILLGVIFFVVPGIYLAVRWSVSVPALIAEETGVFEALRRSGEEVRDRFWPVLGVSAVFWAAFIFAAGAAVVMTPESSLAGSIFTSVILDLAAVGYWVAAVAVYIAGRSEPRLAEVFA